MNGPIIRIEDLKKEFTGKKQTVEVLEGVNIEIGRGEVFGIIGKSGAGKSTLVRCMNYLERPTSGKVFFNGTDLGTLTDRELQQVRRKMSMIFQQFNLLMQRTALRNVCFPLEIGGMKREEAEEKARHMLELVSLADKADAYPSELSGGQKQRVAIARALATDPEVILCDEATSALDPETTKSILALLSDINEKMGITIVVITHEMSVVEQLCSQVAIIDDGTIAETGSVTDIFIRPQSEAAKRLVFPSRKSIERFKSHRACRIVFDGRSSFEPLIANMVLDCNYPVNILFADTQDIRGKAMGQMIFQLPDDEKLADKMLAYLKANHVEAEEVKGYV
ncbi:MAG: ATP-binding cassette domain-containing protein [Clostridia bacterium]|nr:ATP-binding cassette domain-containing protein [Clostridia bacterium]